MFAIETVHPPGVVENQNNETENRTLLSEPEAQIEAKDLNSIERLGENDAETEGDGKPDCEAYRDQAQIGAPVASSGLVIGHFLILPVKAVV